MADIVDHLLELRTSTAARSALRRGTSEATEYYAYPWLAHLWAGGRGWRRVPLLRFAGLVASAATVEQDPTVPLGTFLRRIADAETGPRNPDRQSHVARKLVMVQTGDVEKFHRVVRTLVATGRGPSRLDWHDTWDSYRLWDLPVTEVRQRVRRRLLETYYQTPTADREQQADATAS